MRLSRMDLGPMVAIIVGGTLGVGATGAFLVGLWTAPAPAPAVPPAPAEAPAPAVQVESGPLIYVDGVRIISEWNAPLYEVLMARNPRSAGSARTALAQWLGVTGTSDRGVEGVESIEVIKGFAAVDRFGEEAAAGAILITLKQALGFAELIEAGRFEEAVALLAESDAAEAQEAAELMFEKAYADGYQQADFAFSIRGMSAAKRLPHLSEATVHRLNFWHGYSMHRQATADQQPQTVESASATLPRFRAAMELMGDTGDYPEAVNVDLERLLGNVGTYIEIQEAIIERTR